MYSVAQSCPIFVTLWTIALQALLSMGFPRQKYWSGLPSSPPGDLHDPETDPTSLQPPSLAGGLFTNVPPLEAPAEGLVHASPADGYGSPSCSLWLQHSKFPLLSRDRPRPCIHVLLLF